MEHLQNIAHLLEVNVGKLWPMSDESEEELNIEFHALKLYSMHCGQLLPWQSYHNWLRLMVLNFDSIPLMINISFPSNHPSNHERSYCIEKQ